MRRFLTNTLLLSACMAFSSHAAACTGTTVGELAKKVNSPIVAVIASQMDVTAVCKMQGDVAAYNNMLQTQYRIVPKAKTDVESDVHAVVAYLVNRQNYIAAQEVARASYLATKGILSQMDVIFISSALKPSYEDTAYEAFLNKLSIQLDALHLDQKWSNAFTLSAYSIVYDDKIGKFVADGMVEKNGDSVIKDKYKSFTKTIKSMNKEMRTAYEGKEGHEH